ncbi:hypothetical protein Tco_0179899 [Tanacetum coccineum]
MTTKRRKPKKVVQNNEDKQCIAWIPDKEIALCKAWVRISKDSVDGWRRQGRGRGCISGSTINGQGQSKEERGGANGIFKNFHEDVLARLMVNEYVDLTRTYKKRKSKKEVKLRAQEISVREMKQRRQDLKFYLQPTDCDN